VSFCGGSFERLTGVELVAVADPGHARLGDVIEGDEIVVAGHAMDGLDAGLAESGEEILQQFSSDKAKTGGVPTSARSIGSFKDEEAPGEAMIADWNEFWSDLWVDGEMTCGKEPSFIAVKSDQTTNPSLRNWHGLAYFACHRHLDREV
jgi:hypothetical protein